MSKLIIASAASVLIMGSSTATLAATSAADCQALFDKADINRDGSLQSNEASVFLDAMTQAQVRPQDASKVSSDEFMAACQKDAFAKIDPSLGSSTTISNQGTGQSQPIVQTEQSIPAPAGVMVSNLIGADIISQTGEKIGQVKDVVLSPQGKATHVIIEVGDKDVEIDRAKLDISATENGLKVVINATQAELAGLPAVNTDTSGEQTAATSPAVSQQQNATAKTTPEEQATTPQQPEVSDTIAAPEGFMVSNFLGATVKNEKDENLGKVKDVVFSDQGQPTHFLIDIGGKVVEVEKSKLNISASEDGLRILVNGTQADLAQLPAVNLSAPEQQTAEKSSQPEQPTSTETSATSKQEAASTQTTTAEQPSTGETSTEAQAPSTEQPAASGETTSAIQAPASEQPSTAAAPAEKTAAVEQPSTSEAAEAQPTEQALAIPEGLMVSDIIGATVYSPSDEKLGEIDDLSLSSGAGQPPRVIIGFGGFFGIGEKDASVDMSQLKFTTTENGLKIVLDATKQDLENLAVNSAQ